MSRVSSTWVGALSGHSTEIEVERTFELAGVEWASPASARIEIRARALSGRWSRWVSASVLGHDSEGESAGHAFVGQPVWFGAARRVQVRVSEPVEGLSLHFVAGAAPASAGPPAGVAQALPLATPQLETGPGQPAIIARHAWAGSHGPAYPPVYGDVRMAFVHHTDNPNGYSAGEVPGMLLAIYDYHRYVNGWNDIGYNFVIDLYGRIWEARAGGIDQAVVGAQAGGYNTESTGVAVLGSFGYVLPTRTALSALEHLLAWKLSLHGVPVTGRVTVEVDPSDAFYTPFRPGARISLHRVAGHRDGCTTTCPGDALYGRLPDVRSAVAGLAHGALRAQLAVGAVSGVGAHERPAGLLTLGSASLVAGDTVTLQGALGAVSGQPVASAPLELQSLATGSPAGHVRETTVGTVTTGADGRWALTMTPTANLLVRALHTAPPAAASPLVAIAVAPAVTLEVVSPSPLEVQGTVSPAKRKVRIEVFHAAGHRRLAAHTSVSGESGTFSARLNVRPGRYRVRAITLADADNVEGESPVAEVTV